jgi:hypothetical protein
MSFGMVTQRKLMMESVKELLIKHCPMDKDKIASIIVYETGLTKDKTREYIKIFFDMGMIVTNDKGDLEWKGKS